MAHTADVVVIGGGIVGCATAYFLAREGLRVALVERGEVASGTSSACGGWVLLQDKQDPSAAALALRSRRLYELLAEEAEVRVVPTGGLMVAPDPQTHARLAARLDSLRAGGIRCELLDGPALQEAEPALAPDLAGGTFCPDEAVVDPPDVCRRLVAGASRLGATVLTGRPVVAIEVEHDRVVAVRTPQERIAAPWAVCACGVWSPEVGALAGVRIPVEPRRGHIAAFDRALVRRPVLEAGYLEVRGLATDGIAFVAQPHPDGSMLVGSSREFRGFDRTPDPRLLDRIWVRAIRFLPELAHQPVARVVVGLRPYTPLRHPLVGQAGPAGFVVATGHEGEGVTLAPVTAALVCDLVTGRRDRTGWDPEGFTGS